MPATFQRRIRTDPDAARFLRAIGPSNNAQDIHNFVTGCKQDGTWNSCDWIWPFAGKSLATAMVPLKAPGALTPLKPINMVPADYTESIGVTGDGTTKYMTAQGAVNMGVYSAGNISMSGYVSVPADVPNGTVVIGGGNPRNQIWPQNLNGGSAIIFGGGGGTFVQNNSLPSPIDVIGLYLFSEISTLGYWTFRGIQLGTPGVITPQAPIGSFNGQNLFIGATNDNRFGNTPQQWFNFSMGFAHIGTGMSPVQITLFNARVETLMVAMGRRPSPTTIARMTGAVDGLVVGGQSLAIAVSGQVVSGAKQVFGHLSFPPGPGNWNGSQDFSKFTQLSDNGQVSGTVAVNNMSIQGYPRPWLVGGAPQSATATSGIKQGTIPYNHTLQGHLTAYLRLKELGITYIIRGHLFVHGEQDDFTNIQTYQADSTLLQQNYQTDLQAITGQGSAIPMYFSQESSWAGFVPRTTALVATAQWASWVANPSTMICVCPKYMFSYNTGDHVHFLNGIQYRWLGEYYSKAIFQTITTGTAFLPLAPISVTRTGANIVVVFNRGGLLFDTTIITDPSGTYASRKFGTASTSATDSTVTSTLGFEFMDDNTTNPSASITGFNGQGTVVANINANFTTTNITGDTLTINLSGTPTSTNKRLRFAFTGNLSSQSGPVSGARGCLRDADVSYPSQWSNTLYNWCLTFDLPAT